MNPWENLKQILPDVTAARPEGRLHGKEFSDQKLTRIRGAGSSNFRFGLMEKMRAGGGENDGTGMSLLLIPGKTPGQQTEARRSSYVSTNHDAR